MPIAFPQKPIGHPIYWANKLNTLFPSAVQAQNVGNPGIKFSALTLNGGRNRLPPIPTPGLADSIGFRRYTLGNVETRPQHLTDGAISKENEGILNTYLTGISRDSSGAVLGNCKVMVFRTEDKSFVDETVSNGSGVWSLLLLKGGPFFIVEYKAGIPDVAGTSLNTLIPIPG